MLTFTAANWATNQTVRVSAAEDDADHLDEIATISHTVTSGDGDYNRSVGSVTVTVTDDEKVPVTVSFGAATYTIDEGDDQVVTVTLSANPERTVVIPFVKTEVGATSADYGGVPSSVTFRSGDTEQTFTVTTVNDTVDDDDERIELSFGTLPDAVTASGATETTIEITDDDVPQVTVSFEESSYRVAEGGIVEVTVTLSADPERDVTVDISATGQDGATEQGNTGADYSGVPGSVMFGRRRRRSRPSRSPPLTTTSTTTTNRSCSASATCPRESLAGPTPPSPSTTTLTTCPRSGSASPRPPMTSTRARASGSSSS